MEGIKEYRVVGRGDRFFYLIGLESLNLPYDEEKDTLVYVTISDWNLYLTPWKAENPFKKGEYFGGRGETLSSSIISSLVPMVEKERKARKRYIIGYSLSALFALFISTLTPLFHGVGSVSGSLWYEDFVPYLSSHTPKTGRVFLSLGKKEERVRNKTIQSVREKTMVCERIIREKGIETTFILENGGHFGEEGKRIERCIEYFSSIS